MYELYIYYIYITAHTHTHTQGFIAGPDDNVAIESKMRKIISQTRGNHLKQLLLHNYTSYVYLRFLLFYCVTIII